METVETAVDLGERIRESRIAAGLTQEEMAARIGVDRSALVRIESGDRRVSALELFATSDALRLPISHFVHKSVPTVASARADLSEDDTKATKRRYRADARLQVVLRDAEWFRDARLLAPVEVPEVRASSDQSAREAARASRRARGLSGPLHSMVDVAESFGLFLFADATLESDGSSLTPTPGFGVALVSSRAEPARRRFTAAHELGHHLLGDEYSTDIGVATSRDEKEHWIDSFAAELLLPTAELQTKWVQFQDTSVRDRLIEIAGEYRVSWSSAIDCCLFAELLSADEGRALRARIPVRGDFLRVLGAEPAEDVMLGQTGRRWQRATLAAYVEGKISGPRAIELTQRGLRLQDLPDRVDDLDP